MDNEWKKIIVKIVKNMDLVIECLEKLTTAFENHMKNEHDIVK